MSASMEKKIQEIYVCREMDLRLSALCVNIG